MNRPRAQRPVLHLLVTMGDPCGIGPEVCVKALASRRLPRGVRITVVGSRQMLQKAAEVAGVRTPAEAAVLDLDNFPPAMLDERRPSAESGRACLEYIVRAVAEAKAGRADAIVTMPISKEAIGAAGSPYPGHTEMLGALTGVERPVMLLVSGGLRVAFVTTHMALRDVPHALTAGAIVQTAEMLAGGLRQYFAIPQPCVALCALNPHSSDGGRFGDEESRIIAPAADQLRRSGLNVCGPLPSDTLFTRALAGDYDGVVALYHDQGMIPIKLSGLAGVVNVTLGLPIIRTSPGHGTAFDIAGKGIADESSTLEAIRLATSMARCRR